MQQSEENLKRTIG